MGQTQTWSGLCRRIAVEVEEEGWSRSGQGARTNTCLRTDTALRGSAYIVSLFGHSVVAGCGLVVGHVWAEQEGRERED